MGEAIHLTPKKTIYIKEIASVVLAMTLRRWDKTVLSLRAHDMGEAIHLTPKKFIYIKEIASVVLAMTLRRWDKTVLSLRAHDMGEAIHLISKKVYLHQGDCFGSPRNDSGFACL